MIKSILSKLAQGILIISLVYAGSLVVVEESAEKTEKTEKSEEAIHRNNHSNSFKRALAKQRTKQKHFKGETSKKRLITLSPKKVLRDFNINFIYTTSYLDSLA